MQPTAIDWADMSWNPIVGCTHNCEWCYARQMAKRLTGQHCQVFPSDELVAREKLVVPDKSLCEQFWPHLHPERLDEPLRRRKPTRIFLGSMCDMFDPHVEIEWRDQVVRVIEQTPQHRYMVFTKRPALITWAPSANLCIGVSVTGNHDRWRVSELARLQSSHYGPLAIAFEPLLGPWSWPIPEYIDWVIIGRLTGPQAAGQAWDFAWVTEIIAAAQEAGAGVFIKENVALPQAGPRQWADFGNRSKPSAQMSMVGELG
jgi:protein gp37